jgi:hypothetical protein
LVISDWTSPADYTYSVTKTGVYSLRVKIAPTHSSYSEKTVSLRVDFEDTNYDQIVIASLATKISEIAVAESLAAIGAVTGPVGETTSMITPFLAVVFPFAGAALTNFLIVKNQFRLILYYPINFPENYQGILKLLVPVDQNLFMPVVKDMVAEAHFEEIYLRQTKNEYLKVSSVFLFAGGLKFMF